jgi:hypothetical protein
MIVFFPAIVTGTKNMNAPMPLYTNSFQMWRDAVRGASEVMAMGLSPDILAGPYRRGIFLNRTIAP